MLSMLSLIALLMRKLTFNTQMDSILIKRGKHCDYFEHFMAYGKCHFYGSEN
jgi:hypothetical protein